jgi:AcrR family transcriptional regulator
MSKIPANKQIGRPRSQESRAAILDATWELLKTTCLRDLSIEAIARESGVGKTTIYRWWTSKTAVVMDAFFEKLSPSIQFPQVESAADAMLPRGAAQGAIAQQIALLIQAFSGDYGRILAQIIAEGQACPQTLANYRDRFLYPRREAAKAIIQQGINNGEFAPNLNPELAIDLLYGAIYFRLLVGHLPLDQQFADELAEWGLKALKLG